MPSSVVRENDNSRFVVILVFTKVHTNNGSIRLTMMCLENTSIVVDDLMGGPYLSSLSSALDQQSRAIGRPDHGCEIRMLLMTFLVRGEGDRPDAAALPRIPQFEARSTNILNREQQTRAMYCCVIAGFGHDIYVPDFVRTPFDHQQWFRIIDSADGASVLTLVR